MASKRVQELKRRGDLCFSKTEKINSELFSFTYGAIVVQMVKDCHEDIDLVNEELHRMGQRIGTRLVEEFLVHAEIQNCVSFQDTVQVVAKVGFRMFLGFSGELVESSFSDSQSFSIKLPPNNPFVDFVELPSEMSSLVYGNLLCGVIKGALEAVRIETECFFSKDVLRGDEYSEITVSLKKQLQERVEVDL